MINMEKQYEKLYHALQDQVSKVIVDQRLKYFNDRDRRHLWKMFEIIEPLDKDFRRKNIQNEPEKSIFDLIRSYKSGQHEGKAIVLYGCGGASKMPLHVLRYYGLDANLYCDKNPIFHGKLHNSIQVISPEQLVKHYGDALVITASFDHAASMLSYLTQSGFPREQVYYSQFFPEQMYFGFPEFCFSENETYLDCGVSDGATIKQFSDKVNGKYNKIVAFEPEPACYTRSRNFIENEGIARVELMNIGVFDRKGVICFSSGVDGAAHISNEGDIEVEVKTIDDVLTDEAVTFIKMDIEGAELPALKGAERIIKTNKPKLAICLYHKPEDIPMIPEYILSIVPEYKLWIRPYEVGFKESGDVHIGETILYASI
ncbi:FkbM family methyltransferase [Paenibacillus sp. FSL M7-0802]|nr:FkbM family methyltransferase [Paenibacillus polymyxa]